MESCKETVWQRDWRSVIIQSKMAGDKTVIVWHTRLCGCVYSQNRTWVTIVVVPVRNNWRRCFRKWGDCHQGRLTGQPKLNYWGINKNSVPYCIWKDFAVHMHTHKLALSVQQDVTLCFSCSRASTIVCKHRWAQPCLLSGKDPLVFRVRWKHFLLQWIPLLRAKTDLVSSCFFFFFGVPFLAILYW